MSPRQSLSEMACNVRRSLHHIVHNVANHANASNPEMWESEMKSILNFRTVSQIGGRQLELFPHPNCTTGIITTIFPRIYARRYYAPPRVRVMSFSGYERSPSPIAPLDTKSGKLYSMKITQSTQYAGI
jgi:hypothetical protein